MFQDIPVDVGIIHEGERIRGAQMYAELGGPKNKYKFELCRMRPADQIENFKVNIIGKELKDIPEGSSIPFGILLDVYGTKMEKGLEPIIERRIHDFLNYIQGFMHLNQRYDIWLRVSKESVAKGLTLKHIGLVLLRLMKSEFSFIEKIQVTFILEEEKIKEHYKVAMEIYEARDARVRKLRDDDVDTFYGCTLCQSFAPTHTCVITPDRISLCGSISWFDARAAAKIDPEGPNFPIKKGDLLDETKGEYSGINEVIKEKSGGELERIFLYSMFGHPHTSCGCFESIGFYIPEINGIGIVPRDFRGTAVNGLKFSQMAEQTGGGEQTEGFIGMAIEYMRSPKFMNADGGWKRIVWMPKEIKNRVKDYIPSELFDKIATEETAPNLAELKEFLKKKGHPVVKTWEEKKKEEKVEEVAEVPTLTVPGVAGGGVQIIFKNAKIFAEKVIIQRLK